MRKSAEAFACIAGVRLAEGMRGFLVSPEVSREWLAELETAQTADPWTFGFAVVHVQDQVAIGMGGYKGAPGPDGVVEIAYGIVPAHEGKGYATELAQALVSYAFDTDGVTMVRAHTLPEPNASTRVLEKCGFTQIGEVVDPEDGPVWRWELAKSQAGSIGIAP
ncbi:MAG: GNAT family N-acetyltransferase [Sedimentisphaerales bacterium]|nr:GNAT family N-acetyltransferase [Sedimentisphaerales bacterium]